MKLGSGVCEAKSVVIARRAVRIAANLAGN
jgi:hypothetical protein